MKATGAEGEFNSLFIQTKGLTRSLAVKLL